MLVRICGHSQEFFALGKTVRTAQNPWDSTGHSGERGQIALRHKSHRKVSINAHCCFLHRMLLSSRCACGKKKKKSHKGTEFRNYNIN